jgi:hypothetical protein
MRADAAALNTDLAREVFDASVDFTVGIEEEFQIVDPETLLLARRFEELEAAGTTICWRGRWRGS